MNHPKDTTACARCSGKGWVWVRGFIDPDEPEADTCPSCDGGKTK